MDKAEEFLKGIFKHRHTFSRYETLKLMQLYADEQSIKVEHRDEYTTILSNQRGDTFTFNPQKHEGLADFFFNQ